MNVKTAAFAFCVIVCAFQFGTWLFIRQHPEFAADEIMKRSTLGYALIYDLKWRWYDDEHDLTSPGLTREMVINDCSLRAHSAMLRMAPLPFILALGFFLKRSQTQAQT